MEKDFDELRKQAARRALDFVQSHMQIGLGTGRTTAHFVAYLGQALQQGVLTGVVGVPTSEKTADQARRLNIPLVSLEDTGELHLAVDGADEVDPQLNLIKGLGRALLREKIVEIHARRLVIVVDEAKLVSRLGEKAPLPVEVAPFGYAATLRWLGSLGCRAEAWLEEDGSPAVTDNGNYLARCWFEQGIENPFWLAQQLAARPGVVEHGLFLKMASQVIVAGSQGIQVLERICEK